MKICVGIIFGGRSTEYEVSLQSVKNIIYAIDRKRFNIVLLNIDKYGYWHISDIDSYSLNKENLTYVTLNYSESNVTIIPKQRNGNLINIKNAQVLAQVDVIFPIIHGKFGEDGTLQGMLKMVDLPFVGSDILGSAVCMDKDITKRLLRDAGFKIAPFISFTYANFNKYNFKDLSSYLGIPFFIKPANQGSSIGVSKVYNKTQFTDAINLAFKFDSKVIIEANISGREIECAILGNDFPQASVCGEVIVNNDFYSYEEKYINKSNAQIIIPAKLNSNMNNIIREIAISVYQVLNCQGMARVDVFLTINEEIVINEVNTLPGFTTISMYPKLWQASGISYSELISRLIDLALERHKTLSYIETSINKIN